MLLHTLQTTISCKCNFSYVLRNQKIHGTRFLAIFTLLWLLEPNQ